MLMQYGSTKKIEGSVKGKSLLTPVDDYVVLDLETTGLDPVTNMIIEIGAVRVKNNIIVAEFAELINPHRRLDPFITSLTGITDSDLKGKPDIKEILPRFLEFVGDSIVVGHNVNFDINFIYNNCERLTGKGFSNDFIDTMRLSRKLFPSEKHHRLTDLEQRFCLHNENAHRALSDVITTNDAYQYMKKYMSDNNIVLK